LAAGLLAVSGCGVFGGDEAPRAGSPEALKLPPEFELDRGEGALSIPGRDDTTATASGSSELLPEPQRVRVKRAGTDRWLLVGAEPAQVWGWLPGFFETQGVDVERQRPEAGIIETEWIYTQKPLTRGPFAPTVDSRDAATAADRYLLRVEPGPQSGTAEVFVAHRRAARQGAESWRLLPRDPFLEAEVLRSLAIFMGVEIEDSFQRVAGAEGSGSKAELVRTDDGELRVVVPNGFADAWRRVGLALDRAAFTVVGRNRAEGHVDVRFDTREARGGEDEESFFGSLAFWRSEDIPETIRRLRLSFRERDDGRATQLRLTSPDGDGVTAERREEILGVLAEQIR
jgi:outer membrane protein assembly factor BamC